MMRTSTCILALTALALSGTAAQAAESVFPFHATLQVTEGCSDSSTSEVCSGFADWVAECQAKGYTSGFQAVRAGYASLLGKVTSFEQGCLDLRDQGLGLVKSYVQLTIFARNRDALTSFAVVVFDFAQGTAPAAGTYSITGGTGRFENARGSGTLGSDAGAAGPGWIIYQDGSLRLPGGHR
jgi:hypothetical protein